MKGICTPTRSIEDVKVQPTRPIQGREGAHFPTVTEVHTTDAETRNKPKKGREGGEGKRTGERETKTRKQHETERASSCSASGNWNCEAGPSILGKADSMCRRQAT